MCNLFGTPFDEWIGKSTEKIYPDKNAFNGFGARAYSSLSTNRIYSEDIELIKKDGTVFWATITGAYINQQNLADGAIWIVEDNSDRKASELELHSAKKKAEIANKAKSQFLANMSHEIRTPMNAVLGYTQLLKDTTLDETQKSYLETISDSGELLLGIINDILDISQIEAGKINIENIDFNLHHLIENLLKIISPKVVSKNLDIFFNYSEDIPDFFSGDPTRIRQIIINLMNNAVKFTEQGSITINISGDKINEQPGEYKISICVIDTGIGIDTEKQQEIFRPFMQGEMSTTRKYGGSGLGLYIIKKLTGLMNGGVTLVSEKGKGSEFTASIILGKSETGAINAADSGNADLNHNFNIADKKTIIIEETEESFILAENFCKKSGLNLIEHFSSYENAYKILETSNTLPDIIICSVKIPEMNGYAFAEKLRAEDKFKNIRLVALTADALPGSARQCETSGFDAYLPKPVSIPDFSRIIRMLSANSSHKNIITKHMAEELILKGKRILITEDNSINMKLISTILKKLGCETDEASNGSIAVEKIRSGRYDAVLMDIQMPVMSGIEAAQEIRNSLKNTTPIVALTAGAMKEDQEAALKSGMNDFLTKPVDRVKLKHTLEKWCAS